MGNKNFKLKEDQSEPEYLSVEHYNKEINNFLDFFFKDKEYHKVDDYYTDGKSSFYRPDSYEVWLQMKKWLRELNRKFLFGE
jgi:hypothetical protein